MLRANAPLLPVSLANKILKYYRRSTIVLYSLGAGTASTGGRSHTDLASVWADLVLPTVETFQGLLALVSAHNSALLSYNQHGLTPVLWRELQGPHWLGPRWQKYYKSTTKFGHFFFFFNLCPAGRSAPLGPAVAPLKDADNFPPKTTESGPVGLRFYLKLPIIKGRWLGCHFSLPDATFNDILSILLFFFL